MKAAIRSIVSRFIDRIRDEPNLSRLKKMGLVVGRNLKMMSQCRIDFAHCWHISIGDDVTLAPRVHILAHDASMHTHLGYTRIGNVRIGDRVFIGASTTILPGVDIGNDCIIGAGSVVSRSIPAGYVAAGNPARILMTTDEYLAKQQARMIDANCFDESFTVSRHVQQTQKEQMLATTAEQGFSFVK